jgi:dTDP-4-amino-4,6-dideoxygalactose transaminase
MPALAQVAERHGLAIIEDCCQAHLATCAGRPVGSFGAAAGYSFYPTKNLGALGDGGALTTNDDRLAERARRLRNGGQSERYRHAEFGVNSRLDEIQAAILRQRLQGLREATARRREIAQLYRSALEGIDAVTVPPEMDNGHVYHLFAVLARDRGSLQRHLLAQGVETLVHYPIPLPRQPAFASEDPARCPIAGRLCDQVLSLPLYPGLDPAAVEQVAAAVAMPLQPAKGD